MISDWWLDLFVGFFGATWFSTGSSFQIQPSIFFVWAPSARLKIFLYLSLGILGLKERVVPLPPLHANTTAGEGRKNANALVGAGKWFAILSSALAGLSIWPPSRENRRRSLLSPRGTLEQISTSHPSPWHTEARFWPRPNSHRPRTHIASSRCLLHYFSQIRWSTISVKGLNCPRTHHWGALDERQITKHLVKHWFTKCINHFLYSYINL